MSRKPSPTPPIPLPGVRAVFVTLLAGDAAILLGHVLLARGEVLGDLFDLDCEANLPTWYSSLKFVLAAAAAAACYLSEASEDETPRFRKAWLLVAAFMLALSADETGQIHETLTDALMSGSAGENFRAAFGATEASDSMLWVIVFSPLMILAATALLLFYLTRFKSPRWLAGGCAAAVLLLATSAFLETREAAIAGTRGYLSAERWQAYLWYVGFEEMAEHLAVTLLVTVHYAYAMQRFSDLRAPA